MLDNFVISDDIYNVDDSIVERRVQFASKDAFFVHGNQNRILPIIRIN